jgi:hypothetical protein
VTLSRADRKLAAAGQRLITGSRGAGGGPPHALIFAALEDVRAWHQTCVSRPAWSKEAL